MRKKLQLTGTIALAFAATIALSACTSGDTMEDDSATTPESSAATEESTEGTTEEPMADPAADLVGPGCEEYAEMVPDGAGSIQGMSEDPVAVAASNNPMLTSLVAAVSGEVNPDVNLVDTLNGDEFTVFAPVDDAFAKIDDATMETLSTDADLLTSILTYHVVPGQIDPADIEGTHTTVEGSDLEVTGSGDEWMVDDAQIVCGGVKTANATVYLIDSVLMPSS